MIKRLAGCVREYKKPTILTLIIIVGEAFIETFIPFITAKLVNLIKHNAPMEQVVRIGLFLVLMACLSLCCGGIAGATCAKASTGFARNLRHDMFERVQSFSFENIDRFSSASLVTRMTTDVSNVQMSFMMIIRMADAAHPGDGGAVLHHDGDDQIIGNGEHFRRDAVAAQHPADAFLHPEGLRAASVPMATTWTRWKNSAA